VSVYLAQEESPWQQQAKLPHTLPPSFFPGFAAIGAAGVTATTPLSTPLPVDGGMNREAGLALPVN